MKTLKVKSSDGNGNFIETEQTITNIRFVKDGLVPCSKEDADAIVCDTKSKNEVMEPNCFYHKSHILNWDEL